MHTISSTSNGEENVVSMATNLEIRNVLKIKKKKKKNVRKQKNMRIKQKIQQGMLPLQ